MFHLLRFLGTAFLWICFPAQDGAEDVSALFKDVSVDVIPVPLQGSSVFDRFCRFDPYPKSGSSGCCGSAGSVATGAYAAIHVDTLAMMPYVPTGHGASGRARPWTHDSTVRSAGCETGRRPKGRPTHLIRRFKAQLARPLVLADDTA